MEIVLITIGIFSLWIAGAMITRAYNYDKWQAHLKALRGRVVRLDEGYAKSNGVGRYAVIDNVSDYNNKTRTIREVCLLAQPTSASIKQEQKEYDKHYASQMKIYREQLKQYNERMGK